MEKANEIKSIFKDFVAKENLDVKLSFEMPKGYETAFGTFDNCTNTLYLNFELLKNSRVRLIFNLFHELRHVMQYQKPERFVSIVLKSLPYVIMWDGTCMKLVEGNWRECKLSGDKSFFLQMYLSLPYERNANKFAYEKTKEFVLEDALAELDEIYQNTKPQPLAKREEFEKFLRQIDERTKEKL